MCIVSYIVSWKLLSFNVFCFLKIIPFDYVHNPCSTLATHRSICAPNGISVQACRTCARQPHAYFSQSTLCAPASHKGCSAQKNTCVPTFHKMHLRATVHAREVHLRAHLSWSRSRLAHLLSTKHTCCAIVIIIVVPCTIDTYGVRNQIRYNQT